MLPIPTSWWLRVPQLLILPVALSSVQKSKAATKQISSHKPSVVKLRYSASVLGVCYPSFPWGRPKYLRKCDLERPLFLKVAAFICIYVSERLHYNGMIYTKNQKVEEFTVGTLFHEFSCFRLASAQTINSSCGFTIPGSCSSATTRWSELQSKLLGTTCIYPQNCDQGEKSHFDGSWIKCPLLSCQVDRSIGAPTKLLGTYRALKFTKTYPSIERDVYITVSRLVSCTHTHTRT